VAALSKRITLSLSLLTSVIGERGKARLSRQAVRARRRKSWFRRCDRGSWTEAALHKGWILAHNMPVRSLTDRARKLRGIVEFDKLGIDTLGIPSTWQLYLVSIFVRQRSSHLVSGMDCFRCLKYSLQCPFEIGVAFIIPILTSLITRRTLSALRSADWIGCH
jgi:hypothetical protein